MARKKKPAHGPARKGAAPAPARAPEDLLRRGSQAFREGDYSAAARAWQDVLRRAPDEGVRAALAEARLRAALGTADPGEAASQLSQAVAVQPERAVLHYHLGLASLRRGDLDGAILAFRAAQERAPDEPRYRFHLALALLRRGTPDAAAAAARVFPEGGAAGTHWTCLRVAAHLVQGNTDAAYGAAARAPATGAVADDLALARALMDLGEGATDRAIEELHLLSERTRDTPVGATAQFALGVAAAARGEAGEAARHWDEAIRQGYGAPEVNALRAGVLHRQAAEAARESRFEDAAGAWEAVLAIHPKDETARRNLRRARLALGDARARAHDLVGAIAAWEEVLRAEPGNLDLMHNLALAYERLERREYAIGMWRQVVDAWRKGVRRAQADEATRRRMATAHEHLAMLYANEDDYRLAIQELRAALRFVPTDPKVRLRLANMYAMEEQWGAARSEAEKVLSQEPDMPDALYLRARALAGQEHFDEAEAVIRKALTIEPENRRIRDVLRALLARRIESAASAGDDGEVERLLAEQVALAPESPAPHIHAGAIALRRGNKRSAAQRFRRAAEISGSADTRLTIADRYFAQRLPKDAQRWLDRAVEADDTADTRGEVVGILVKADVDWATLRPYAESAAATDDPQALVRASIAALGGGQVETALQWASRAIEKAPDSYDALLALGQVYHRLGDPRWRETIDSAIAQARAHGAPPQEIQGLILNRGLMEFAAAHGHLPKEEAARAFAGLLAGRRR